MKFQINLRLRNLAGMAYAEEFTDMNVPLLWFDIVSKRSFPSSPKSLFSSPPPLLAGHVRTPPRAAQPFPPLPQCSSRRGQPMLLRPLYQRRSAPDIRHQQGLFQHLLLHVFAASHLEEVRWPRQPVPIECVHAVRGEADSRQGHVLLFERKARHGDDGDRPEVRQLRAGERIAAD